MIAFGTVAIPVQPFAATETHTVRLYAIHTVYGSRAQHRRFWATWQLSPERTARTSVFDGAPLSSERNPGQ